MRSAVLSDYDRHIGYDLMRRIKEKGNLVFLAYPTDLGRGKGVDVHFFNQTMVLAWRLAPMHSGVPLGGASLFLWPLMRRTSSCLSHT